MISVFKSSISSQALNMTFPNVTLLPESYWRHVKTRCPEPPFWGWWIQQEREWLRAKSRRALYFIQSLPLTNASHSAVLQESHTVCFLLLYKANEQWACREGGWQGCRLVNTRFESCARKQNTLSHIQKKNKEWKIGKITVQMNTSHSQNMTAYTKTHWGQRTFQ